jgi:glycosyltransferase involved in cell wall biosynthesis
MENKVKKTKILIVTDSARIHTGLAENARLVFSRLLELHPNEFEIHQHGWFNFNGVEDISWPIHNTNIIDNNGKPDIDPNDRYGQRTFESILQKVQPDIVWASGDMWCFDHILNSPNRNKFRLIVYYTIDGSPYWGSEIVPEVKSEWGAKLERADQVVVWSEFGKDVLEKSCPELAQSDIKYIYHPVCTDRFQKMNREQKIDFRKRTYADGIPSDAFILGWSGRNQFRKQNHIMWETMHYVIHGDYISCNHCNKITVKEYDHAARTSRAVGELTIYDENYDYTYCYHCNSKKIEKGRPINDIYLWLHMNKTDPGYKADLHSVMWKVDHRCVYTNGLTSAKGLPPKMVSDLYSSWDALLYLSGGEGFGIPALEAMACSVPVIYSNYSSHKDFCKHGGIPVNVRYIPEMAFAIHRSIADMNDAVKKVLWAYNNRADLEELGNKGQKFTASKALDIVVGEWTDLFNELMSKPTSTINTSKVYTQVL